MKIAVFTRYPQQPDMPRGGVEAVAVVLIRALAACDRLDVHVVTLEKGRSDPCVTRDGRATIHRLPGSRWPQIADVLVGPGKRRLVRYLLGLRPDLVHSHETYGLCLGGLPVPHVFTVHGFDHANVVAEGVRYGWMRSRLWRCVERYGLERQSHIISINPYVRKEIEPLTRAAIHDVENPIDIRFFQVERHEEAGRILCVGWVNERKNTLGSVQAFVRVAAEFPESRLIIAGHAKDAGYRGRVEAVIEAGGLGGRVEWVGHVDRERLRTELARASIFLLPSRQENAPMAIAEAMAVGVPVISSDRCGMPYMIEQGATGLLTDPEDDAHIAAQLRTLLGDPAMRERMSDRARTVAAERFHPDVVARRTVEVYQQVLAHRCCNCR